MSKILLAFFFLLGCGLLQAQTENRRVSVGFGYGFGNELKNSDYTYTNHFYKLQLSRVFKQGKHLHYEVVLQPEVNFGTHQLLNKYFIQPNEPDFEENRRRFTP